LLAAQWGAWGGAQPSKNSLNLLPFPLNWVFLNRLWGL